jgi:hypothetical protein
MRQAVLLLALVCLLAPSAGCDKVSPVAPAGTTLAISASPASIPSATGTSTITVIARQSNGSPVNPGTEIRLDTNLGTIDPVVRTDSSGVAQAILRGDGRLGKATVRATTGTTEAVTTEVQIGTAAKTIVLQANPTTVPEGGGKVSLLALVRDTRGQPLPNVGVNFQTELGQLGSGGRLTFTNARGEARDTLQLSETDLSASPSGVTVTAQTTGEDGSLISTDFRVQVQGSRPVADFSFTRGATELEVDFSDESTGTDLTYTWSFGDGSSSNEQNPTHRYPAAGTYTVRLTVESSTGESDVETKQITVPVPQ